MTTLSNGATETEHWPLTPDERLKAAARDLDAALVDELFEAVRKAGAAFLNRLVIDLFEAMGYDVAVSVEYPNPERTHGLDGVVRLDPLGIDKAFVRAKYQSTPVGTEDIDSLEAALAKWNVRHGVFITTATYTPEAINAAALASPELILIDGHRLARMMLDFQVGVSVEKTIALARIDKAYFEEP